MGQDVTWTQTAYLITSALSFRSARFVFKDNFDSAHCQSKFYLIKIKKEKEKEEKKKKKENWQWWKNLKMIIIIKYDNYCAFLYADASFHCAKKSIKQIFGKYCSYFRRFLHHPFALSHWLFYHETDNAFEEVLKKFFSRYNAFALSLSPAFARRKTSSTIKRIEVVFDIKKK